jgi:hypothetical protein
MIGAVFSDITKPFGAVEAWFYDRFLAPAVAALSRAVEDRVARAITPGAHIRCVSGYHCVASGGRASCVPNEAAGSCAEIRCVSGFRCVEAGGTASCVSDCAATGGP